jgi:hypothetical protein
MERASHQPTPMGDLHGQRGGGRVRRESGDRDAVLPWSVLFLSRNADIPSYPRLQTQEIQPCPEPKPGPVGAAPSHCAPGPPTHIPCKNTPPTIRERRDETTGIGDWFELITLASLALLSLRPRRVVPQVRLVPPCPPVPGSTTRTSSAVMLYCWCSRCSCSRGLAIGTPRRSRTWSPHGKRRSCGRWRAPATVARARRWRPPLR